MIDRNSEYGNYSWVTSLVNTILLIHMDDTHLKNSIFMLRKWAKVHPDKIYKHSTSQEWLDLFLKYTNQYEVKTENYEIF